MAWLYAILAFGFLVLWRREVRRRAKLVIWANRALATMGTSTLASETMPVVTHLSEETVALADAINAASARLNASAEGQRRAHRELEDVLASLQDAVLVVDGEARLRFLNAAALTLFQVRIEDVLGAQMLEALPSFGLESAVRTALADGEHSASEVALYGPRVREVLLRVSPVRRSDGAVSGAVAIVQDLTEMRRLERVRRDFVANASHELRTPIANIRATAETIMDMPEDPSLAARFLPHLVSEAERLSRLVSDLLDLARADAGVEARHERFDVGDVAEAVKWRLEAKAAENGVTVLCEAEEDCFIEGDAPSIEQVIFNLLDNALAYTASGGQVRISVRHRENEVQLAVADDGIGIPEGELPRVFERFYRVDKARSRAQGGTGLGLAIVKHIVENHSGHVRVESKSQGESLFETEHGTTFTVSLPAA